MIQSKGYAAQSSTTDLAVWDFERREVGAHDVQLEILYCGVCHSDLHQIKDEWFPGIFPMVPGHEIVGKVIKVGDHVKNFKIGDLALSLIHIQMCIRDSAAAGTRVRKAMQDLKGLAQDIRTEVTEKKNAGK